MSRDIAIYGRRKDVVPIADILGELKKRKIALTWKPSSRQVGSDWRGGRFHLEGTSETRNDIIASTEPLDDDWRQDAVESHADQLGDTERRVILSAKYIYNLHAPWSTAGGPEERPLIALAYTIADLADGIVVDTLTNKIYDRTAYRKANPWLAGETKRTKR